MRRQRSSPGRCPEGVGLGLVALVALLIDLPPAAAQQPAPAAAQQARRPAVRPGGQASRQTPDPAQRATPAPLPSERGAAVPSAPGLPPPAANAAVPEVRRLLADIDAGGIGEALSDVPNFIGDGCAPGAATSKVPVGRLSVAGLDMRQVNASATSLVGPSAAVYTFPDALGSVGALQAAGVTGIPAGAQGPRAEIKGPITLGITNPAGGPGSIATPGNDYQSVVDGVFRGLFPGSAGTTTYVAPASGFVTDSQGGTEYPGYSSYAFYDYVVDTAVLMPGANVGFVKLSENVSPLPRDRVYFNYSFFDNALLGNIRNDVNRFTPGFEKTFADGWTSIEVRTPFATTVANTQTIDPADPCGLVDTQGVVFGNMSVVFKSILALGERWALTGGMQVMLPTAGDVTVLSAPGGPALVRVDNQSVRLMPFTGFIWAPDDTFFSQALFQIDTAANGNPAFLATPGQGGLTEVGQMQYPTFMYLSFSTGYWAYRSDVTRLTGFAPIAELHVNQAFQASDVIQGAQYRLGADYGVMSLVNGLVGCNLEWGRRSTLTFAYVTPFGGGADRWFDGEFRAFWNHRFGPQNRLTRVQF